MSRRCEFCQKGTMHGNSVPRKGLPRKKGGGGQHILSKTKRTFRPNILKVRAQIGKRAKIVKICSRCLKAGKIEKAS